MGAGKLITNNLLLALGVQERKLDADILLLEGKPDSNTLATIDNRRMRHHLTSFNRQPQVAVISWHHLQPNDDGNDVILYTENEEEAEVKMAAMTVTTHIVYVVVSASKITEHAPPNAKPYPLSKLIKGRVPGGKRINSAADQYMYFVTDIDQNAGVAREKKFLKALEAFKDKRVEAVTH
jgi:hypothetical protein